MIPYKVNPVKATCIKFQGVKDFAMQGMNDTCFGICTAFSGTTDPYNCDPECAKACENLIEQKRRDYYGVGRCDHQAPYRPVSWQEIPPYFPALLRTGMNPDEALEKSKKMCKQYKPHLLSECLEQCDLFYSALELPSDETQENFSVKDARNTVLPTAEKIGTKAKNSVMYAQKKLYEKVGEKKGRKIIGIFLLIILVILVCYFSGRN